MNDYERDRTPMYLMAGLLALGASGRQGRKRLRQLKRICGWGFLQCFVVVPLILYFPRVQVPASSKTSATENGDLFLGLLGISVGLTLLSGVLWCYLAIAKWLTNDDEDENR